MTREPDPYRIPRAGWEIVPSAGLAAFDLNGNDGALTGQEWIGEHALGGTLVFAIYQTLLSALRTEAMRRRGEIARPTQGRVILASVWETTKNGAAVSVVLSLALLIFPWLSLPLTLLGVMGLGKASLDLFHAFWDGLSPQQRQEVPLLAGRPEPNPAGLRWAVQFSGDPTGCGQPPPSLLAPYWAEGRAPPPGSAPVAVQLLAWGRRQRMWLANDSQLP